MELLVKNQNVMEPSSRKATTRSKGRDDHPADALRC
jgi:hypothetical protein